jgi:hypothetical protein
LLISLASLVLSVLVPRMNWYSKIPGTKGGRRYALPPSPRTNMQSPLVAIFWRTASTSSGLLPRVSATCSAMTNPLGMAAATEASSGVKSSLASS